MSARELTRAERRWALAAAIPFLASLLLAGFAIGRQTFLAFGIGWPLIQIGFYIGAARFAGCAIDHPLVKSQVMLHWMMMALVVTLFARAT